MNVEALVDRNENSRVGVKSRFQDGTSAQSDRQWLVRWTVNELKRLNNNSLWAFKILLLVDFFFLNDWYISILFFRYQIGRERKENLAMDIVRAFPRLKSTNAACCYVSDSKILVTIIPQHYGIPQHYINS